MPERILLCLSAFYAWARFRSGAPKVHPPPARRATEPGARAFKVWPHSDHIGRQHNQWLVVREDSLTTSCGSSTWLRPLRSAAGLLVAAGTLVARAPSAPHPGRPELRRRHQKRHPQPLQPTPRAASKTGITNKKPQNKRCFTPAYSQAWQS